MLTDYLRYGTLEVAIVALPFDIPGVDPLAFYDLFKFDLMVSHLKSLHPCAVSGWFGVAV